jgi:dienelactone hydrolase
MSHSKLFAGILVTACFAASCSNNEAKQEDQTPAAAAPAPALKEETVTIQGDGASLISYIVYDDSVKTRRPAVLVIPEWWGLNDYPKMRARELAKLGYVALVVDMFGDGKVADNPDSAGAWAKPFYMHPEKAKARIDAAIAKVKTYPQVDTANIGAIGYCFGGGMLINTARLGDELKSIVSFHGSLLGTPAKKGLLKTKLLILHGNADPMVNPQVAQFKKQMDSIGADYKFIGYDSAMHAFTNPAATEIGKKFKMPVAYNAAADTASWKEMQSFFSATLK